MRLGAFVLFRALRATRPTAPIETMPLVTVTIPCYDDTDTLPIAMASLLAQSIQDWECVIVDDGSASPVEPIVARFGDDRFRVHTFSRNRGRPVARQKATEMARGEFICMLDADDWYYPDKLERQLRILREDPSLAAVSSALAVVDDAGELTGVRSFAHGELTVRTAGWDRPPRLSFPSTMLRCEVAKSARFDPRLVRAEDPEYLTKALAGRRYATTRRVGYAYREQYSPEAVREALVSFRCQRLAFAKHFPRAPVHFAARAAANLVKTGIYRLALATGGGRWLFERRNRPPTPRQRRVFEKHRRSVERLLQRYMCADKRR